MGWYMGVGVRVVHGGEGWYMVIFFFNVDPLPQLTPIG